MEIFVIILNLIALILMIIVKIKTDSLFDTIILYIKELEEALDRSRAIRRMYEEENQRCWKAVQVWETNCEELKQLLKDHKIEIPQ